jgi:hypothetical protein
MAPSRILEGSASGMGRSTECLCYSVDGEFCRKESLRQLFLVILVCLSNYGRDDQQSAFVTLLTENSFERVPSTTISRNSRLPLELWPC